MSIEDKGWRIAPLLDASNEHKRYVKMMADQMRADPSYMKRPATTNQSASILAIWDEQNNKLKDMTESQIAAHQNRPLPTVAEARVEIDAEKIQAELMAKHPERIQSAMIAEEQRRKSKNTQGDYVSTEGSYFKDEVKELARQAFSYTPPAKLSPEQELRLVELSKITEFNGPIVIEEWKPLSPAKAFWHWLTGNEIKADESRKSWRDL